MLLSFIGGLAGLAVAYALSRMILALAFPDARNMPVQASPSLPVLAFAFLVSLLTGVLFGTAPAWLSSQASPPRPCAASIVHARPLFSAAKSVGRFAGGLSVVLLAAALLMARTLANLEHQNFGIATANRYVLEFDPRARATPSTGCPRSTGRLRTVLGAAGRGQREP